MRLFSILAAIIVTLAIYAFVFERDRLLGAPGTGAAPETAGAPAA